MIPQTQPFNVSKKIQENKCCFKVSVRLPTRKNCQVKHQEQKVVRKERIATWNNLIAFATKKHILLFKHQDDDSLSLSEPKHLFWPLVLWWTESTWDFV